MVQRGQQVRFAPEPRQTVGVGGDGFRQDLHRDVTPESRVARAVDLAHAAGPDGGEDLEGADGRARLEAHGMSRG